MSADIGNQYNSYWNFNMVCTDITGDSNSREACSSSTGGRAFFRAWDRDSQVVGRGRHGFHGERRPDWLV
jgi:hypothetical protein